MEWARSAKFIHVCLLALAESFISWLIEFKRGEIATELREFWLWRGFIIYGVQLGIFSTDPCRASSFGYGGRNGARLLQQQQQQTWGNFLSSGKCEPGFSDEQKIAQILRFISGWVRLKWIMLCDIRFVAFVDSAELENFVSSIIWHEVVESWHHLEVLQLLQKNHKCWICGKQHQQLNSDLNSCPHVKIL